MFNQLVLLLGMVQERKSRIVQMCRLLEQYTVEDIGRALVQVPPVDAAGTLEHTLYALKHPEFHPEPFTESHTPGALQGQLPELDAYIRLMGVQMS